jgi:hypothetical protein
VYLRLLLRLRQEEGWGLEAWRDISKVKDNCKPKPKAKHKANYSRNKGRVSNSHKRKLNRCNIRLEF